MFKSNKTTNFNRKTHFKPTCLCIVRYVRFTDTICHMIYTYVSNNSQALTIRLYDTKLFVHNTIRIVRYILYWQDDRKLVARLQSRGGIGRFLFQPSWGFLPSSIRPYRLCKVIHETSHKNLYLILPMKPIQHNLMWLY